MKQASKVKIATISAAVLASLLVAFASPLAYAQSGEDIPIATVTQATALVGVVIGSVTRSIFMFYAKKASNPDVNFSGPYAATLGFSIAIGVVTAVLGMGGFAIPENPATLLGLFYMAFFYGWGLQDLTNELVKRAGITNGVTAKKTE